MSTCRLPDIFLPACLRFAAPALLLWSPATCGCGSRITRRGGGQAWLDDDSLPPSPAEGDELTATGKDWVSIVSEAQDHVAGIQLEAWATEPPRQEDWEISEDFQVSALILNRGVRQRTTAVHDGCSRSSACAWRCGLGQDPGLDSDADVVADVPAAGAPGTAERTPSRTIFFTSMPPGWSRRESDSATVLEQAGRRQRLDEPHVPDPSAIWPREAGIGSKDRISLH
ncbi:hypothetical protein FRAAL4298 [Frankia alni ACN14a]|uniref:Uncharacterized protein n=1 Tax=Frankia alni (strain DSM 45986 / CECT 9034 / ACN14a) TaxID=326424 RepID=Q0RHT3_FRAAA|nr:hypothetical protein FRAAL4298 [Frankia alni ACN14a]